MTPLFGLPEHLYRTWSLAAIHWDEFPGTRVLLVPSPVIYKYLRLIDFRRPQEPIECCLSVPVESDPRTTVTVKYI